MNGALAIRATVELPYRPPFDAAALLGFLGTRAVPGVEDYVGGVYRRTMALPNGVGIVALTPQAGHIECTLDLDAETDVDIALGRCRRLLDLDADPAVVDAHLATDPVLAPLVERAPGRRVPGHVDGNELAVRAVLGQQVSVAGARTLAGRLVARYGLALTRPSGALTHLFPTAAALAAADPASLTMPASRRRAVLGMCAALADGSIVLDAPTRTTASDTLDETQRRLLALAGIGPWTVSYIAMRALGDRDAFLPTDLGVRKAVERLGFRGDPRSVSAMAERWRPWRAYATHHLWGSLSLEQPSPPS